MLPPSVALLFSRSSRVECNDLRQEPEDLQTKVQNECEVAVQGVSVERARTLRVLVVTNMYPTPARPGFGIFVKDQVDALRQIPEVDLEVWPFAAGGLRYATAALRLRRFMRSRSFDVVHAHYGLTGWTAYAARTAPLLVTFHGTDVHHRVVGRLSRRLVRRIALVAVASPALKAPLGATSGTAVLPTGVDMERFAPMPRAEARKRLGLDPRGRYLLFPADPARPSKRVDRAEALVETLGNVKLLAMHGVAPDEVPLWINAANAVLVTSDYEGFGLAVGEALACDVPVLATRVGIAPLLLGGLDGALCDEFDTGTWAAALGRHLADAEPRVRGRDRAALFDTRQMAERVVCVYRELAAAGSGRSLVSNDA